jgi:hypothetical protein
MVTSLKHTTKCICCGARLSAPASCSYVDEEFVCYRWICPKCGCEFDASASLHGNVPIASDIVEEFLPDLVVA